MHRLAERLGYTVGELQQRLSLAELRDWMAHDRLDAAERERAKRQNEDGSAKPLIGG